MRITKKQSIAGAVAVVAAVGGGILFTGGADAATPKGSGATATSSVANNSIGTTQIVTNGVGYSDLAADSVASSKLQDLGVTYKDLAPNSVAASKIQDGAITEADLNAALKAKINPAGAKLEKNWGQIFRNTIGNGSAELGTSSAGEGLTINTPSAADQASFGNEKDFAGKPVDLTDVKFKVFTTGENSDKATNNMPSIKFEIRNPAGTATYTTLVYGPDNSTANEWATVDAAADPENHWGFSGAYFNGPEMNARCGMNGTRCTLDKALKVLGKDATLISVAVGKGRDHEFHGAVSSLTINKDTFNFTAAGVTK